MYRALNLVFMAAVGGLLMMRLARWSILLCPDLPHVRTGLLALVGTGVIWRLVLASG